MNCVPYLIAILACLGSLMISLIILVIIKHRKAIARWWKKYNVWKFIVNVFLPFTIPFVVTIVLSPWENMKEDILRDPLFWFLIFACIVAFINLIFQLRFWIKENKDKKLEWKNKAAHRAYYNLYDVIKQKNTEYGITALNDGKGKKTIPPEMIPYDVFDHIRQICRTFKKAVAEIAGIDTVHITVSFIYRYTAKGVNDKKWKWVIGKDSGLKHSLTDFTNQDESLFHYLINTNCSLVFFNDKKEAAEHCSYYFSYKDRLHNNDGSVFASKLTFSNNAETCCEGIIFITTYAEKFVRDNSEVTPEEFKKLLIDEIFPCYKNLLKNELAMLYFKHKDDPKVTQQSSSAKTTTNCSCEVIKKKKRFRRISR